MLYEVITPPVNSLGVPRDAYVEGAVDEYFQKPGNGVPGPVPIGAPVGGRIEYHGYAVFGQELAYVGKRAVEYVPLLLVVARLRGKSYNFV